MSDEIRDLVEKNLKKIQRREERKKQMEALEDRMQLQEELNERAQNFGFTPYADENNCYMNFDGEYLDMYRGNQRQYHIPGMSGNPNFQRREYQNVVNTGPLPEGVYYTSHIDPQNHVVRGLAKVAPAWFKREVPTDHNVVEKMGPIDWARGLRGEGTWPGGYDSWGNRRVKLIPDANNNMMGRDNFYIHGGTTPGSNGCIDINYDTDLMEDFVNSCQRNIPIRVKYPKESW